MGQNLYTKYKPLTFDTVMGHAVAKKELIKRAKKDDYPQCVMFTGITGVGKTVLSHLLAKSIMCNSKNDAGEPCNKCETCQAVNQQKPILNYSEYNASNLGIDDMRIIEESACKKIAFSKSNKKVIYIDELQELVKSKAAMKNLLKILERPLKNTFFILGTMDETKIDKAVKNRCTIYKLNILQKEDIQKYIYHICVEEKVIDPAKIVSKDPGALEKLNVLAAIAENSGGSMRTAISILERAIYSELWTKEKLYAELSILTSDGLVNIVNSMLKGEAIDLDLFGITEDILNEIKVKLVLYYQHLSGNKLEGWQKHKLQGLNKTTPEILSFILAKLFDLQKFTYLTTYQIVFTVLDIVNDVKNRLAKLKAEEDMYTPFVGVDKTKRRRKKKE